MLRCPRCSEVLSRKRVADVELDGCRSCGGSFFDAGELTTIARDPQNLLAVDAAFRAMQPALKPQSTNACPRCQTPMTAFEQPSLPGIELDACKTCKGIWLDGGEPTEIAKRRGATVPEPVVVVHTPEPSSERAAPPPKEEKFGAATDRATLRVVLGLTFTLALIAAGRSVHLLRQPHASGHVIAVETVRRTRRSSTTYAVVNYAVDGKSFNIRRSLWGFEFLHVGDPVDVLYADGSPEDGTLDTFLGLWGIPIFILVLGGIFAGRIAGVIPTRNI